MNNCFSLKILKEDFNKYKLLSPLLEIKDTPKNIFLKAKNKEVLFNFLNKTWNGEEYKLLTIVGSRNNSTYSKDALSFLIKNIFNEKIIIVSGLAIGIDALAHKEAIDNNIKTLAIPGSGLGENYIAPRENFNLAKSIIENEGLLLSEHEDDAKIHKYFFPMRNRLMAMISDAVFIVEAKEKSGTLITGRLAMEYGRNLGILPNTIFSENSKGSNNLIKEGAFPILSSSDILELLNIENKNINKIDKNNFENIVKNLSNNEKIIFKEIFDFGYIEKDLLFQNINKKFDINQTDFLITLMNLEINNLIKEELGQISLK